MSLPACLGAVSLALSCGVASHSAGSDTIRGLPSLAPPDMDELDTHMTHALASGHSAHVRASGAGGG